jgi:hypothetical protein
MTIDDYAHEIILSLKPHYIPGGIAKLREKFPASYDDIEKELEKDFSRAGLDKYKERLVKGLKLVNCWREQE